MSKYREQFDDIVKKLLPEQDQEAFLTFIETFDRRDDLYHALQDDVKAAHNALKEQPQNQFLRRTVVRTSFAMIEGLLNLLTLTVLETHKNGSIDLTADQIENLTEQAPTRKGGFRPKFMPFGAKVQFSFMIFAQKIGGLDYAIDPATNEWINFESTIYIRNQLMHPRTLADLTLDDKQISSILDATLWFLTIYGDLQRQVGEMSSKRSLENLIKARIRGIQLGK